MRGIYVHVPFCVRKCAYCDFYSVAGDAPSMAEYPSLVVREMDLFLEKHPGEASLPADTVFFGGGTPTALGAEALCGLLSALRERFPIAPDAEVTAEANPGTVTDADLGRIADGGFTRISIGVQSFRAETLSTLGRIHGIGDVRAAYRGARAARFPSVGIDLIFGVPGQTPGDWEEDLDRAVTFLPDHVSAYALAPESGTPLHAAIGRNEMRLPADEEVADMYEATRRTLFAAGYRQYEISNFSRPGAECRHNLKYWRREGYLGLGPSAHGLLFPRAEAPFGLRTANPSSLAEYAGRIRSGRLAWSESRACDREDAWKESLIFGLRETGGVRLAEIERRNGPPPDTLARAVDKLVSERKLDRDGDALRLPGELLFVSNEVLQALA